jgi:DNA replication protein DnaC
VTNPPLARIAEPLQRLKRLKVSERLEALRHEASAQQVTSAAVRDRRLTEEVAAKVEKPVTRRTVMARFPSRKTVERVDFGVQPSVDRKKLQELATGRFIADGEQVVFLGPPGTGKTPWAIALGVKAVQQGHRTLVTSAMSVIAARMKASAENRLEERLKP